MNWSHVYSGSIIEVWYTEVNASRQVRGNTSTQRKGPTPFLGRDVEDRLATWLTKMARIGYGQTHDMLFDKVQDIVA